MEIFSIRLMSRCHKGPCKFVISNVGARESRSFFQAASVHGCIATTDATGGFTTRYIYGDEQ